MRRPAIALDRLRPGICTVLLMLLGYSCASASLNRIPVTNRLGSEPPIRIGLKINAAEVRIGANRGLLMTYHGPGRTERAHAGVTVRRVPEGLGVTGALVGTTTGKLVFAAAQRGEFVTVDGVSYRGTIEVISADRGFNVINIADIEEYLLSVVGSELWSRSTGDLAALKAQAIASRTYALRNSGRYRTDGYDIRADVSDQAYGGVRSENGAATQAVAATRGQVVVFDGELILAFYHSTCGKRTASTEEAFRTIQPQPYLQPVSDARPGRGYFNDLSPHFTWTVNWSGRELTRVLSETLPSVVGIDPEVVTDVRDISAHRTGPSGRIVELRISVDSGEIPVFGPDIRLVLRSPTGEALRSTDFNLAVEHRQGLVSRVTATGWGLGHGVGLCQWGAVGRARSGQDYRTILAAYYRGASVERWY